MDIKYRKAYEYDLERCIEIRGRTKDNSALKDVLESIGVSSSVWAPKIQSGIYVGVVSEYRSTIVGFCFCDKETGEILVLSVLPEYEGFGVGREMLSNIMSILYSSDHEVLYLYASPDSRIRAHGFYRHLGWRPTGESDLNSDERLIHTKT